MEPLNPAEAVPVCTSTAPLLPDEPASLVETDTPPLDVAVPAPAAILSEPPVEDSEVAATIVMLPLGPILLSPPAMRILPAVPDAAFPVCILRLPLAPDAVFPESTATFPLKPLEPEDPESKVTEPLAALWLVPD